MKKFAALPGFSKFDTVSACVKTDLLLISCALLHNGFVELEKMQFNIEGVQHDLRLIEQIDPRLYNVEDTQRVIQELGNKYTDEQQQLRKLCFFNWEALAKDAVGQNLIPDDIFVSRSKIPGKVEFDAIKTSGDGNCLYHSASLILVGNEDLHLLLRLLTVIELFLHASYYARHPKFLSGMKSPSADVPDDIMYALCLSDSGMKMWESTKGREDAIKREAATGCRVAKWSVMVHLMALANVIGRSIFSAFSKDCSKTRPFFHGAIIPRECSFHTNPAVILWSRDGSPNTHPAGWYQPNHFIPLVKRQSCSAYSEVSTSSSSSDNKKLHKDEVKKRPKRNISDFFRGSVPKKPCQEPLGSSTEPKFGNCDEQSFVKSNLSTATPSKSQPLNGDLSNSLPERTLSKEENSERSTEMNSEKRGKESSKGTGRTLIPGLNMMLPMMLCIAWFAKIIQNWQTFQAPFTEVLVALASTDLKL